MKKILFICDYTNIHSRRWINNVRKIKELDVHIVSINYYINDFGENFHYLRKKNKYKEQKFYKYFFKIPSWRTLQSILQDLKIIFDFLRFNPKIKQIIKTINPEIIHSLRIQPEGWFGMNIDKNIKFYLSTWGQDLILYKTNRFFTSLSKRVVKRTDFLFVDNLRDYHIAHFLGLRSFCPVELMPATGGLETTKNFINDETKKNKTREIFDISDKTINILMCRGFGRRYIHYDVVIDALYLLKKDGYKVKLFIDGNINSPGYFYLKNKISLLNLEDTCFLINLSHNELIDLMNVIDFYLSINITDGLPISLLEAIICGMIPILSDLPCYRDWIVKDKNGFLLNSYSSDQIYYELKLIFGSFYKFNIIPLIRENNKEFINKKIDFTNYIEKIKKSYFN